MTAARAGRLFGYVLVLTGLLEFAVADGAGGLWLLFLGWFLLTAARAEEADATVRKALQGVTVAEVMTPNPSLAPDWLTIDAFLQEYALPNRFSAFPIESFDGGLAGIVTLQRIKRVPPKERSTVRVRNVACPIM